VSFEVEIHWFESQCQQTFFKICLCCILTNTKWNCAVTHILFNYMFQKLPVVALARLDI
jgi:hypothetical protein